MEGAKMPLLTITTTTTTCHYYVPSHPMQPVLFHSIILTPLDHCSEVLLNLVEFCLDQLQFENAAWIRRL